MTPLVLALNSALLHLVWQGVVMALLLWIALAGLRRSSASVRYLVSCAALGILTLAPIVTACMAYQRPRPFVRTEAVFATVAFASPIAAPTNWLVVAEAWLLPAWASGVALLSMRLLWGYAKVSAMRRAGDAAAPAVLAIVARLSERIGVTRTVRVLISTLADGSPCVVGWLKPVILLPAASVLGLKPEQLEAVLAHELAHIRRYDYLINIVQMLIETLFFYHPAVWWISSRIRQERELCCDDIAVRCCGDAVGYARALTALERMRVMGPSLALGVKDGPLTYRIQRLLGAAPREQGLSRLPGLVAILLAVTCFSTDMNPVKAQAPAPQPATPAPAPPSAPALTAPPERPAPAPVRVAQVFQPPTVVNPSASSAVGGPVTVEVTIDQNGLVSDARVVTGPTDQRRLALITALGMRFPPEDASSTRWVDVPAYPPAPSGGSFLRSVPTQAGATNTIRNLKDRIESLIAQQTDASPEDKAKLQASIDSWRQNIQDLLPIAGGQDPLVGSMLAVVQVSYLTDADRDRLLAQLPIHVHDILTDDSMRAAVRVAHEAIPNATIYFGQTEGGQAGLVLIAPPPPRPTLPMR